MDHHFLMQHVADAPSENQRSNRYITTGNCYYVAYRGADKSLARAGSKQVSVSVRIA